MAIVREFQLGTVDIRLDSSLRDIVQQNIELTLKFVYQNEAHREIFHRKEAVIDFFKSPGSSSSGAEKGQVFLNETDWQAGSGYIGAFGNFEKLSFSRVFVHEFLHALLETRDPDTGLSQGELGPFYAKNYQDPTFDAIGHL